MRTDTYLHIITDISRKTIYKIKLNRRIYIIINWRDVSCAFCVV